MGKTVRNPGGGKGAPFVGKKAAHPGPTTKVANPPPPTRTPKGGKLPR